MSILSTLAAKLGLGGGSSHVQNAIGDRVTGSLTSQELANMIGGGYTSSSGAVVSEATAMRVSAVYACVALIAGAISTLPLTIYQRTPKGREAVDHPYWWLLNEQPNAEISSAVFWEYMVTARLFYGDCFAEIVRPSYRSGTVSGLVAHHPLRVQPFRDSAGDLWYRITPLAGAQYVLSPSDVLHIPSLGYDGISSPSPITYAAQQSVGTSLATAEYNAKFFANGARPDFILQTDGALNKEQAEMIRSTWTSRHGGSSNAHMPAVLTGGLKAQALTLNAVDSQILQTANWNLEEVCRILGVPPFMVGSTEKSTSWGTGQENMGRGFVKYTLLRDLVKIQREINRKFWPTRETYFVEFDVSAIERGDLKSENEALRVALGGPGTGAGWMTPNEVRHLKLLPPIDGGDELFDPMKPVVSDPNQQAADKKQADATAKNLADMRLIANDAQKPTIVNVAAPVINLTVPEQAAPIVQNTVNLPETVVNVEAVMPEQAAPIVQNTVHVEKPDAPVVNIAPQVVNVGAPIVNVAPAEVSVSLPDRRIIGTVERNSAGQITKTIQTETDI